MFWLIRHRYENKTSFTITNIRRVNKKSKYKSQEAFAYDLHSVDCGTVSKSNFVRSYYFSFSFLLSDFLCLLILTFLLLIFSVVVCRRHFCCFFRWCCCHVVIIDDSIGKKLAKIHFAFLGTTITKIFSRTHRIRCIEVVYFSSLNDFFTWCLKRFLLFHRFPDKFAYDGTSHLFSTEFSHWQQ